MYSFLKNFATKSIGREVEKMRRILSLLIAVTMVISASSVSFAAFTVDDSETYSASSGVVGGGPAVTVPFSASLKNISGDTASASISWSSINAGSTGWKAANQYIAVEGFATYSDWGIQIYTDNDNYTGTGEPAGLVNVSNTIYSLPMSWRTRTEKLSAGADELDIVQEEAGGFQVLDDGITPDDGYYPWFFMLDKNTTDVDVTTAGDQAYGNYQAEATFIGSAGYHHAPGAGNYATPTGIDTVYYVYLGANFTLSMPGATYSTSTLTVEMYHL